MGKLLISISELVRVFPTLLVVASLAGSVFSVFSLACFLIGLCSTAGRREILERRVFHLSWLVTVPLSVILILMINPRPLKLREERKIAFERVQAAGGWEAIKSDCHRLSTNRTDANSVWFRRSTNYSDLPPAIAALKPIEVRCYTDQSIHAPIVRIHVLGLTSTDNAWPHYGFWIVCSETPPDYKPNFDFGAMNFNRCSRLITNSVFEIY